MLPDARLANLLEAVRDAPESPAALRDLAIAYNARTMPDEAREICERWLETAPSEPRAWFESIVAHSFGGPEELEPLRGRLEALASERPQEGWPQRNLGLFLYLVGDDDAALRACGRALELDPDDSHAHETLAYLHFTVGDVHGAIESAIQAVELAPDNFRALHWLGWCFVRLDAWEQATRYFQRSLRVEESYFLALQALFELYLAEEGTHGEAMQCFGKILSVNPRYFPAWFRLADTFIQRGELTLAAAQARSVLLLAPDATAEAEARQYLGLILLLDDESEEATTHFRAALELDPGFAAAHHYLGVALEQGGDTRGAAESYRKAVACDEEYALPLIRLGYLSFDRKEYEKASRLFERARSIDDEEYMAHLGLGEIARWRKDYTLQLEHCQRAAELAPDDSNARNQLGTAHDALGDVDEAEAEYEAALDLDPWNRHAANNLGYLHERAMKRAESDEARERHRGKAIDAWRRRLLICRDLRTSTRGARNHLIALGVAEDEIERWLGEADVTTAARAN